MLKFLKMKAEAIQDATITEEILVVEDVMAVSEAKEITQEEATEMVVLEAKEAAQEEKVVLEATEVLLQKKRVSLKKQDVLAHQVNHQAQEDREEVNFFR